MLLGHITAHLPRSGRMTVRAAAPPNESIIRPVARIRLPRTGSCGHCGGPTARCTVLGCRPSGLTQVSETASPGRYRARMVVRWAGDPAGCPLTAVITDPPVIPAEAAGLPQMVPSTRVPELTGAIEVGTARSALLV